MKKTWPDTFLDFQALPVATFSFHLAPPQGICLSYEYIGPQLPPEVIPRGKEPPNRSGAACLVK